MPDLLFEHLKAKAPWSPLSWAHIVEAVKHEMYPVFATSLKRALDTLQQTSSFDAQSVNGVIDALKQEKSLSNTEVDYFCRLMQRVNSVDPNTPKC